MLAPRPDLSRFYELVPMPENSAPKPVSPAAGPSGGLTIGLGPITLPAYLDRPQIVTRVGANELRFSEADRWAQPLDANFARVLAQDLAMGAPRIYQYPWYSTSRVDYQVEVDVQRFELLASDDAELIARWTILDEHRNPLYSTKTALTNRAESTQASDGAAALSTALANLSDQIAAAVGRLSEQQLPSPLCGRLRGLRGAGRYSGPTASKSDAGAARP